MRYQISGKQIDIGEALQTHVEAELNVAVQKYAERPTDALVVFSKSGPEYVCETTVHLSTGLPPPKHMLSIFTQPSTDALKRWKSNLGVTSAA